VQRDAETIRLPRVSATDRPSDIGPVALLLFTTQGQHLPVAVPACEPVVSDEPVVLPLLNGMDISERIAARLPRGTVLGALTYLPAKLTAPGVVHQAGEERRLVPGPLRPQQEAAARRTLALLQAAGINAELSASVQSEIWTKFIAYLAFVGAQGRGDVREELRGGPGAIRARRCCVGVLADVHDGRLRGRVLHHLVLLGAAAQHEAQRQQDQNGQGQFDGFHGRPCR
jgi:ketopantoate reductase